MSSTAIKQSSYAFLEKFGAEWTDTHTSIAHFGNPESELAAFENSAVLVPLPAATTLLHEGSDAIDLLHRLSTNDLLSLEAGKSAYTVLTSERGRVIDVLNVSVVSSDRLMLISGSADVRPAMEWIDRFTIIEDAEISDVSGDYARFALLGESAFSVVETAFSVQLQRNSLISLLGKFEGALVVSSQWADTDRVDLVVPPQLAEAIWTRLIEEGAVPAGATAYQAVRVEKGVPASGTELTEDSNPLGLRLKDLISFSKGCYVGQEVVARLDTYDKLQRRMVKLESETALAAGDELKSLDGKRAGVVTSVSPLTHTGVHLALGFARRNYWDEGTVVKCGDVDVTVRALPESAPFS